MVMIAGLTIVVMRYGDGKVRRGYVWVSALTDLPQYVSPSVASSCSLLLLPCLFISPLALPFLLPYLGGSE
jgi:hypothetical protein